VPRSRSTGVSCSGRCKQCGKPFSYTRYLISIDEWDQEERYRNYKHPDRVFCGQPCAAAAGRNSRRKLPDPETLISLYVDERLSTCKIAHQYGLSDPATVRQALLRYGIKLRTGKLAKSARCRIAGCSKPVFKIRHTNNGTTYGTLCKRHWDIHRAELGRWYRRKKFSIAPRNWLYQHEVPKPIKCCHQECGYAWRPRTKERPKKCPRCQRKIDPDARTNEADL